MRLEDLQPNAVIRGVLPNASVTVVSVTWHGSDALTLVYRTPDGRLGDEVLFRKDEERLERVQTGRPWSFETVVKVPSSSLCGPGQPLHQQAYHA